MENLETIEKELTGVLFMDSKQFLAHWQGHRKLTRRVIEAFDEDKLFNYSLGGMRPFAEMAKEIISMSGAGVIGVATDNWSTVSELDHHSGLNDPGSKEALLAQWDTVTEQIELFWPQISADRFAQVVNAFGQYRGEAYGIILYFIDNEIHHRAQGTVYLRSLGIEPPAFWDRD